MKHSHVPYLFYFLALASCQGETTFRGQAAKITTNSRSADELDANARRAQIFNFTSAANPLVNIEYDIADNKAVYEFDLPLVDTPETKTFLQATRERLFSNFEQNQGPRAAHEATKSESAGALDIAVIIDNSPSMAEEQNKLAEKLSALLSQIQDVDWRMTIVTTDYREKPLDKNNPRPTSKWCEYLTPKSKDLAARFQNAVRAGTGGFDVEAGFLRVEHLFKYQCEDAPKPWYRTDAAFAVLIVSDEDNCSDGTECWGTNADTQYPYRSPAQFLAMLRSHGKVPGTSARIYGIIGDPADSSSNCGSVAVPADEYSQAIHSTGGISGPICASSYESVLVRMSKDFRQLSQYNLKLAHAPNPGSPIIVKIDGVILPQSSLAVNGETLSISSNILNAGDLIEVDYVWGESLLRDFDAFPKEPLVETISATINEIPIPASAFTFVQPKTLRMIQPPPAGTKLQVSYIPVEAGKGKANIETGIHGATNVTVLINKDIIPTRSWKIDTDGNLVFKEPPPDGAQIEVRYITQAKNEFRHAFSGEIISESIEIRDLDSGALMHGTVENNVLKISKEESLLAKRVRVSVSRPLENDSKTFQLPSKPVPSTVTAKVDGKICELEVSADSLAKIFCQVAPLSKVVFQYSEQSDISQKTFLLNKPLQNPAAWSWRVLVEGKSAEIEKFDASSFTLVEYPANGAHITLTITPKEGN
jgi:hypothetical protein